MPGLAGHWGTKMPTVASLEGTSPQHQPLSFPEAAGSLGRCSFKPVGPAELSTEPSVWQLQAQPAWGVLGRGEYKIPASR